MRIATLIAGLTLWAASASATTLEQLSMAQMAEQATSVVRAKVSGSYAGQRNGSIYTFYRIDIIETLKSQTQPIGDVAVPGGTLNGLHQSVAGAPQLEIGSEYVLFLWTSKSGLTQIIGLSQGALDLLTNASGQTVATRAPINERMLNAQGQTVNDQGLSMGLSQVRNVVKAAAGGAK